MMDNGLLRALTCCDAAHLGQEQLTDNLYQACFKVPD